jgi:hypothetical protein
MQSLPLSSGDGWHYPDETLRASCASSKSLRAGVTQDNKALKWTIYVHEKVPFNSGMNVTLTPIILTPII